MTLNIEKIKAAALAATQGKWMRLFGERTVYDRMEDGCRGNAIVRADTCFTEQDTKNLDFIATANPSVVLELITRLEAAEQNAAIGEWFCNYMASARVDLDDYLVEACHDDDPVKFKAAALAAMKENK